MNPLSDRTINKLSFHDITIKIVYIITYAHLACIRINIIVNPCKLVNIHNLRDAW